MSMTPRVPAVAAGAGTLVGCAAWLAGFGGAASAIWAATTLLLLVPLTWSVVKTLARGDVGVDAIALLAMGGALAVGEYLAGAVIAVMLAGGNALEAYAQGRAGRELSALVSKIPTTARVRRGGDVVTVPVDRLDPGDRMVVNTGDTVAADAQLVSAHAVFDTSSLTGEPLPVDAAAGAQVASGSVNAGPPVELDVIRRASESTYAAIVRLVESAAGLEGAVRSDGRPVRGVVPGGDRGARCRRVAGVGRPRARGSRARGRHPVPADPGCAGRPRLGRVPGGEGRCHRERRGSDRTARCGAHRPARQDRDADAGHSGGRRGASAVDFRAEQLLVAAASLDQASSHVVAKALVAEAERRSMRLHYPLDVAESPGQGIRGRVNGSAVAVGSRAFVRGLGIDVPPGGRPPVAPRCRLRSTTATPARSASPTACGPMLPSLVDRLHGSGIRDVVLATGDQAAVAHAIADQAGIEQVHPELSAEQKMQLISELRARSGGAGVVMVGDGVNDAPALALADVGIAMTAGSATAASQTADAVIVVDPVTRVADAIAIGQRSMHIARQSVLVGLGLSGCGMVLAAVGLLPPIAGALAQEAIDVGVILNALRALRS